MDRLAAEWIAEHRSTWSEAHLREVSRELPRLIADLGVASVKDVTLRAVIAWRSRQHRKSPRTLNLYVGHLRACLAWAASTERIARNPLSDLAPLRVREQDRRLVRHVLTRGEAQALRAAAGRWDETRRGGPSQSIVIDLLLRHGDAAIGGVPADVVGLGHGRGDHPCRPR